MKHHLIGQSVQFDSREVVIERFLRSTSTEDLFLTKDNCVLKYSPLYTTHGKEMYKNEITSLRFIGVYSNIIELKDSYVIQANPPIGLIKFPFYANSSLFSMLKTHTFSESQILQILRDLLTAMSKLEEIGIIHRNISLKNILVSDSFEFVLSGFSSSALLQDLQSVDIRIIASNTEKFTHPQLRPPDFGPSLNLRKMDMWALGCILHLLIYRRLPSASSPPDYSVIKQPALSQILSSCLSLDPEQRGSASSLRFQLQSSISFALATTNAQLHFPSTSIQSCLLECINEQLRPPETFFLTTLMLKAWTSSQRVEKTLKFLQNADRELTLSTIKSLIVIHRLMISGPASLLNSENLMESILAKWQHKTKTPLDENFSDYYAGLIRQFCRVLLDKIKIHKQSGESGNWKQAISIEQSEEVLQYLNKILKVCDGLSMGMYGVRPINDFIKFQLLEECQRAFVIVNGVLVSNNSSLDVLNNMIQRVAALSRPSDPEENKAKKYGSHHKDREQKNSIPDFPKLVVFNNPQEKIPKKFFEDRWRIRQEDLVTEKVLASGSSCTVFKGKFKCTPVAIKVMKGTFMGRSLEKEFEREITAMLALRHPNLVLFMGACSSPQMIIVSEFCAGGSLFALLHENKNVVISWKQKQRILRDVARGMLYLHEAHVPILHRDLKSLNILLVKQLTGPNDSVFVKITDFGVARVLEQNIELTGQMGTCHWMAPEVLSNQPYALEADVYSYGIVMWEVIAREIPYNGTNPMTIPMRVVKGERPNLSQIPSTCPNELKDLLRACWDQNPSKRPNFNQVLDVLERLEGN